MTKLTIRAFHQDQEIVRGKTSLPATASELEIQAKLQAAAKRAGIRKIDRLDVLNPDDTVLESWTVDFENKTLHKTGAELSIPATPPVQEAPAGEQETTEMARPAKKKVAAKKVAKKKAASNSRKAAGNGGGRGVGVIAAIVEGISRKQGASQDELVTILTKKFPDRDAEGMRGTVKIQANRNAKKKEKDEKRGLVYYG